MMLSVIFKALLSSLLVTATQKVWITPDWPEEEGKWPDKTDVDWRDVYNYNNCIEDFAGQKGLITSIFSYPTDQKKEDICLHMSTGKYCDIETYSMDFKLDGQAYEIKTEADKEWKSYRFGKVSKTSLRLDTSNVIESWLILKGPCGNPESHYHLDTPSPR